MHYNLTRNIQDLNEFNDQAKALNSKIKIVLKFGADDLRFTLTEALTTQEETDLQDLVTNFVDSDPNDKIPKIFDLVKGEARHKHFHNIDYKKELTTALIPKRTVVKGEVTQVDWYCSLDANMEPQDKVLTVSIVYSRDASGLATSRVTTRKWINQDGTENTDAKVTIKYYFVNPSDMIDEGIKRRTLLVKSVQIPVLTFMQQVLLPLGYSVEAILLMGRAFMDDYRDDFDNFKQNSSTITTPGDPNLGKKTVVVRLEDETKAEYVLWMDKAPSGLGGLTTIREYLISEFSI